MGAAGRLGSAGEVSLHFRELIGVAFGFDHQRL